MISANTRSAPLKTGSQSCTRATFIGCHLDSTAPGSAVLGPLEPTLAGLGAPPKIVIERYMASASGNLTLLLAPDPSPEDSPSERVTDHRLAVLHEAHGSATPATLRSLRVRGWRSARLQLGRSSSLIFSSSRLATICRR